MKKNLIFKGGGVRGIAYAGALQVLEDHGIMPGIVKVAGTSAGAITAMLVALKYKAVGIKTIVGNMNFTQLEDGFNPLRILSHFGMYAGDAAGQWLEMLVKTQTGKSNTTFSDLRSWGGLDLHVVSCSLDNPENPVIFNYASTPNAVVSQTVRASMSIPIFFAAAEVAGEAPLYIDGGTVWNYPITIFDREDDPSDTLGLNLTDFTPVKYPPVRKGDLRQYFKNLFAAVMASQDIEIDKDPELENRTIRINALGVPATEFMLSEDVVTSLYQSGVDCATNFLTRNSL